MKNKKLNINNTIDDAYVVSEHTDKHVNHKQLLKHKSTPKNSETKATEVKNIIENHANDNSENMTNIDNTKDINKDNDGNNNTPTNNKHLDNKQKIGTPPPHNNIDSTKSANIKRVPIIYDANKGHFETSDVETQEVCYIREEAYKKRGIEQGISENKANQLASKKKLSDEEKAILKSSTIVKCALVSKHTNATKECLDNIQSFEKPYVVKDNIDNSVINLDNSINIYTSEFKTSTNVFDEDDKLVGNCIDTEIYKPYIFPDRKIKRKFWIFKGWYTKPKGGERVNKKSTVPSQPQVLYAHWINIFAILGLLLATIAILLVLFFAISECTRWYDPAANKSEEEIDKDFKDIINEGEMGVEFEQVINFKDGATQPGIINFKNPSSNHLDEKFSIILADSDKTVYKSEGAIPPGYGKDTIKLSTFIPPGAYEVYVLVEGYTQNDHECVGKTKTKCLLVVYDGR